MSYEFHIDVPGVPRENIEITTEDQSIRLKAEKNDRLYENIIDVGRHYDLSKTEVKHTDGVLYFTLHKAEKHLPHKIMIT